MPQFDYSTFSSQIFWLFVSGFALVFFVRFVLLPRIEIIFKHRKNFLDKEKEAIRALEKQLSDIKVKRQEEIQIAEEKAHNFLLTVKKDLEVEKKQYVDSLDEKMNDKVASFERLLTKKTIAAKAEYAQNVENYLSIIQQEITSNGSAHVK